MNSIYNEIANNHSVTTEEVEKEIFLAITQARKSTLPTAKAFWENIEDNDYLEDIISKIVSRVVLVV